MTDLQRAKQAIKLAKAKVKHLEKVVQKSEYKANQAQEDFLCDRDDLEDAESEWISAEDELAELYLEREQK